MGLLFRVSQQYLLFRMLLPYIFELSHSTLISICFRFFSEPKMLRHNGMLNLIETENSKSLKCDLSLYVQIAWFITMGYRGAGSVLGQGGRIARKGHSGRRGIVRKGYFAMFGFFFCVCKKLIPPLRAFVKFGYPPPLPVLSLL